MTHLNDISKSILISLAATGLLSFGITAQAASQAKAQETGAQQQSAGEQASQSMQSANQSNVEEKQQAPSNAQKQEPGGKIIFVQQSSQILASSIMGMSIQNGTNKDAAQIGTINDLIMNKQHQLVGIVVGVGGFLGIGQKNVGIPWSDVRDIDPKKGVAVVDVTKKELAKAPAFTTKQEMQQKKKQQEVLQKQRQETKKRQEQQQKAQEIMRQKAQPKQDNP